MSSAMYRPRVSAWADLTGNGMAKTALFGRFGRWLGDRGGGAKRVADPTIQASMFPRVDRPVHKVRNAIGESWDAVSPVQHPLRTGLGAVGVGAMAPLIYNEQSNLHSDAAVQAKALAESTAKAQALAKNPPPVPPSDWEKTLGEGRDWAVGHWPLLAGAGVGLGSLGIWYKNRMDRQKEEEEEALLSGMHPKRAALELAREFPVQIGFLARCGERRLTGPEVRVAIEKCAAISDEMAEDWIRFFGVAAGHAASDPSGLTKAAEDPFDPTKVKPDPINPLATTGGGVTATANAAANAHVPAQPAATPAAPVKAAPPVAPVKPAVTAPPAQAPAQAAAPTGPLTNVQAEMARAPSDRDRQSMIDWQRQVDIASRTGDRAKIQAAIAQQPKIGPAAGLPGANRAPVLPAQQLEARNLGTTYESDANTLNQLGGITGDRFAQGQAAEQEAKAQGMEGWAAKRRNLLDPYNDRSWGGAMANSLWEMPGALGGAVWAGTGAPFADAYEGIKNKGWDARQWDWRNMKGSAIEFADPITKGLGIDPFRAMGNEGLFGRAHAYDTGYVGGVQSDLPGSASYLATPERQKALANRPGSVMAGYADKLNEMGNKVPIGNEKTRTALFMAALLPEYSEQILSTIGSLGMTVPGLPGAAAAGTEGAAATSAARALPSYARGAGWAAPGTRLGAAEGIPYAGKPFVNTVNFLTKNRSLPEVSQIPGQVMQMAQKIPGMERLTGPVATHIAQGLDVAGANPWVQKMRDKIQGTGQMIASKAPTAGGTAEAVKNTMLNTGLSPSEGTLIGAQQLQQIHEGAPQKEQARMIAEQVGRGERGFPVEKLPANLDPAMRDSFKSSIVGPQLKALMETRALAGKPMSEEEIAQKTEELSAPIDAHFMAQDQKKIVAGGVGLQNPVTKQYDPSRDFDLTGVDSKNVNAWLDAVPGRKEAMSAQVKMDMDSVDKSMATVNPDLKQRLMSGQPIADEDMVAMSQAGLDINKTLPQLNRIAQATLVSTAQSFNGNMNVAKDFINHPQAMMLAAQKNASLTAAVKNDVNTGKTPDMMTGIKQIWDNLGTVGQLLAFGGVALGTIGLMNTFMGEGGLGSILMTLLGGAGLGLAANKAGLLPEGVSGMLNPILSRFGLDALAGSTPEAEVPGAGAPTPTAAGTPPPATGAPPAATGTPPAVTGAPAATGTPPAVTGAPAPAPAAGTAPPAGATGTPPPAGAPATPPAGTPAQPAPMTPAQAKAQANVAKASKLLGIDLSPQGINALMQTPSKQLVPNVQQAMNQMDRGTKAQLWGASMLWATGKPQDQQAVMKQLRAMPGFENMQPAQVGKFFEVYNMTR